MNKSKDLEFVDSYLKPTDDLSKAITGNGSFAFVFRTLTETGDVRAAKAIDVEASQKNNRDWTVAVREMTETKSLNHPSIVKFYDSVSFSPHELNSLSLTVKHKTGDVPTSLE